MNTQTFWIQGKKIIFLLIVTLIVLTACQAEPGFASEDIIGSWRMDGFGQVVEFKEDGTYDAGRIEFGTFQLEGTLLTITVADEASFCPGSSGTYEIELTEEDKLQWTLIEDECSPRGGVANDSLWSQITP